MSSSEYIEQERKDFALYVLGCRAFPHISDGLKHAARRLLWTARNGEKYKTATLAGATMPLHPHAEASGVINTLAAPYGNNIPLFEGQGAFGTLLNPTAYGAGRYTSVKVSHFAKDVLFKDIDLVPMVDNYDLTLKEPQHFLPLIPLVLLNPNEGVGIGFSCNILPRSLKDIISSQIAHLNNETVKNIFPWFVPINSKAHRRDVTKVGNVRWFFQGEYEVINTTKIRITKLPYGLPHSKFVEMLIKRLDQGSIVDYDDNSANKIDIVVKLRKADVDVNNSQAVIAFFQLEAGVTELMNVIDFDGDKIFITTFPQVIALFTDWRLKWYKLRYQRLLSLLEFEIQKYLDILLAIKKNVAAVAKKVQSRIELIAFLKEIGIINTDYIANLPIYRFTEEEKRKVEQQLLEARNTRKTYNQLINKEQLRREIYINELKQVMTEYSNA